MSGGSRCEAGAKLYHVRHVVPPLSHDDDDDEDAADVAAAAAAAPAHASRLPSIEEAAASYHPMLLAKEVLDDAEDDAALPSVSQL